MTSAEEESAEEEAAESDATTATDVASAHQSDSDSDADVVDERRRGGSADDAEMRFLQARPTPPYPKLRHVLHPGMAGRVKYDDFGIHMPAVSVSKGMPWKCLQHIPDAVQTLPTDRFASAYPMYAQLQKSAT